jgi:hypothetical protein
MVKPFDIEELITRIDILYDKTKKNGHSNSLSGEFKELSLTDVLQIFEHTKKEGTLFIRNGSKKGGSISFKEGMLTDVTYGDLSGEDAMVEFFLLKDGSFHYKSHALSLNLTAKPISFTMMETIRLIDEKFALEDFIPDKKDQLALKEIPPAGDPDVEAVVQVLQAGIKNLYEIQETSGLSRIRTDIATARLLRDKQIEVIKGEGKRVSSPRSSARPFKILFVFTDEVSASEALKKIAETFNAGISRSIKTGVANFLKVIVSDIILHIFSLRGEKRFSFLWEPMIASSDATVFLVKSAQDIEHLEFFRSRLESGMPFYAVSLEQSHAGGEALRMVSRSEDIKDFFVKLLIEISERSKK